MNTGWICPVCGRVYAPFMMSCTVCPQKVEAQINSGVELKGFRNGMTRVGEAAADTPRSACPPVRTNSDFLKPKEEKPGLVIVGPLAAHKGYYEEVRPAGTESAEGAKPAVLSTLPPAKEGDPLVLAWDTPVDEADMPEEKPEE